MTKTYLINKIKQQQTVFGIAAVVRSTINIWKNCPRNIVEIWSLQILFQASLNPRHGKSSHRELDKLWCWKRA